MTVLHKEANGQFGYEILRNHVLSDILGQHEPDILYWAGKSLARKFPLFTLEEAIEFFVQANFGELVLERTTKDEIVFSLSPPSVETRCFKLEAGFLAQQKQQIDGFITEAHEEIFSKKNIVRITLKSDLREKA